MAANEGVSMSSDVEDFGTIETKDEKEEVVSDSFMERLPMLLLALGSILIAFYVVYLAARTSAMLSLDLGGDRYAPTTLRVTLEDQRFWRIIYNLVFNTGYLYLIIGVVLLLIGVHLKNNARWNWLISPVVVLCLLNLVWLVIGFISIVSVVDWGSRSSLLNKVTGTILVLMEMGALVAIILIEVPVRNFRVWATLKELAARWRGDEVDEEVGQTKEGTIDSPS